MAVADGPDVEGPREIAVDVGFDKVSAVEAVVIVVEVVDAAGTLNAFFKSIVVDMSFPDGLEVLAIRFGDVTSIRTEDCLLAAETDGPPTDVDRGYLAEVRLNLFEFFVVVIDGFAAIVAGVEEDGVVVEAADFTVAVAEWDPLGGDFNDIDVCHRGEVLSVVVLFGFVHLGAAVAAFLLAVFDVAA